MDLQCYRRALLPLILVCLYHSINSLAAWDITKLCFTEVAAVGFEMIQPTLCTLLWPCTHGSDCCGLLREKCVSLNREASC